MHPKRNIARSAEALTLPILPNILTALEQSLAACAEADVLFCSHNLLLPLLDLPENEVNKCFEEVEPGLSERFRALLNRAHPSKGKSEDHPVFRMVNWNGRTDVCWAKHLAWCDGKPAVDELYLLLGFLHNERSGTRRYLLAKLGEETFNRLRQIASDRAQARDLRALLPPE